MNATAFGGKPQEVITPESLLFDAAERIGRIRDGRMALHIHLSRLQPQNREENKVRIAFRLFEGMVDIFHGQIFLLTSMDIMLICKDARLADLDAIVYKLKALFNKDPLAYSDEIEGQAGFASVYDLSAHYDDFLALCAQLVPEAKKLKANQQAAAQIQELDAKSLVRVLSGIGGSKIASALRRQPCVRITDDNTAEVMFQEFYMSIAELQKELAPDVNLLSNRWLFQHLSQVLDLKVLEALQSAGFQRLPAAYSLNLNMSTVESPMFRRFHASLGSNAGLFVEFQLADIFSNLDTFIRVRDDLKAKGIGTVLDGMNSITLEFLDAELYETDFVKVSWSGDMANDIITADLTNALGPVGFDHVILSRCDSEASIEWGLDRGIRHFQGRYLDSMVAAVTMTHCDKAAACTLNQCNARHAVISGPLRGECGNNEMLDSFPSLRAIR